MKEAILNYDMRNQKIILTFKRHLLTDNS